MMHRAAAGILIAVAGLALPARVASGQVDPGQDAALHDPSIDEVADQLDRPAPSEVRLRPAPLPGTRTGPAGKMGPTIPEGTFLIARRGRLRHEEGRAVFVFDRDEAGMAGAPIELVPCATLQRMEDSDHLLFVLTGQVLAYRGVNYLIPGPSTYALTSKEGADAAREPEPETDAPVPAEEDDPTPAQLIERLEARRRASDLTRPPGATRETLPAAGGAEAEGRLLTNRDVRFERNDEGAWIARFDNDADDGTGLDAPARLVPCAALEQIERTIARDTQPRRLKLSGRIFTYRERRLLLPTLIQTPRPNELMPLQ